MIRATFGFGIPTASILIFLDGDFGGRDDAVIDAGASPFVFNDARVKDASGSDFVGRVMLIRDKRRRVARGFSPEADATPTVLASERQLRVTDTTRGGDIWHDDHVYLCCRARGLI